MKRDKLENNVSIIRKNKAWLF